VFGWIYVYLCLDGVFVVGFGFDRGYLLVEFDIDVVVVGFMFEYCFVIWDLCLWMFDVIFVVSVLRCLFILVLMCCWVWVVCCVICCVWLLIRSWLLLRMLSGFIVVCLF